MIGNGVIIGSISLLLVRCVVAVTFGFSSYHKLRDIKKSAAQNKMPAGLMLIVGIAEAAGALGLVTGILGQLAALGLMLLMLVTMGLQIFGWKSPYWAEKGGWEYDLLLFTLCSTVAAFGVGTFAL